MQRQLADRNGRAAPDERLSLRMGLNVADTIFEAGDVMPTRPKPERLAMAAIERDRNDATALAVCGHARSFLLHDYDAGAELAQPRTAGRPLLRAGAEPGELHQQLHGRWRRSRAAGRAQHSPVAARPARLLLFCNAGIAHYARGDYETAVRFARRAAAQKKVLCANLRMVSAGLVALGQIDEARATATMLMEIDPNFRLSRYRDLCPWQDGATRETFLDRLRQTGLPA